MISTILNMSWILGLESERNSFWTWLHLNVFLLVATIQRKSFLKRYAAMNMRQWISIDSCNVALSESHRIGKAVDFFSMRSIQCPKPICFHLTLACQGSKSKCWKPRVSTITFKLGGVPKALIIPVKPFMKRMAITDLAGMHSQLHETRNKKKHYCKREKRPECVPSSFILLSAAVTFRNHLDTLQIPTNVDHANCYLYYNVQCIFENIWKRYIFFQEIFLRSPFSKISRFTTRKINPWPWCLEKRLETRSSIKQGCVDGFTSQPVLMISADVFFHREKWWFVNWVPQPIWKINISQIGSFPQVGVKIKKKWNHHLAHLWNRKIIDSNPYLDGMGYFFPSPRG